MRSFVCRSDFTKRAQLSTKLYPCTITGTRPLGNYSQEIFAAAIYPSRCHLRPLAGRETVGDRGRHHPSHPSILFLFSNLAHNRRGFARDAAGSRRDIREELSGAALRRRGRLGRRLEVRRTLVAAVLVLGVKRQRDKRAPQVAVGRRSTESVAHEVAIYCLRYQNQSQPRTLYEERNTF